MRWSIGLLIVISLLLVGCAQSCSSPTPSAESPDASTTPAEPPPENQTWISPGKVEVGNFYPGARAEYSVTIHNGGDEPAEFSVTYRQPGDADEGYIIAPSAAEDWVMIADPAPLLAAKETRDVLIAVGMPKGAQAPPKWEFWIAVKDVTQTGMVHSELACRWLVTMK